jgi:hypothetical protein
VVAQLGKEEAIVKWKHGDDNKDRGAQRVAAITRMFDERVHNRQQL